MNGRSDTGARRRRPTRRFVRRAALRAALGAGLARSALGVVGADRTTVATAVPAAAATGASLELPALAPAFGLAAGLAVLARRPRRAASVVAGALAGAGVAIATRQVWAVAPHDPAAVVRVNRRPERLAAGDGTGLTIVGNPKAGGGAAADVLEHAMSELPGAVVVDPGDHGGVDDALRRAAPGATALGVVGGDGSINAAAAVALEHHLPLAVFPGGTLNHFARDVGLRDAVDTADAVRSGDVVEVDVGLIGDRHFLNTASFGSYAELVDAREELEERLGKWPAMALALVRVLRRATPLRVEIDGRPVTVWMIFIGNCRYQPAGLAPGWRERLDDRLLDVRWIDGTHPWCRLRLVVGVLTGRLGRSPVYEQRVVTALHVRSLEGPLRLACDGETFDGGDEVTVSKHDQRLVVYAPVTG